MRIRIEELPISDEMKSDLCEGIDTCREFSVRHTKLNNNLFLKSLVHLIVTFAELRSAEEDFANAHSKRFG